MRRLVLTGLVVLCTLAGCGARSPSLIGALREVPKTDKIEKFFIVLVGDKEGGGCTVDIQPKSNGTADWVKVKKKWRVAWFIVNTCSAAKDIVPKIVFVVKDDPDKKVKKPIDFNVENADVLIGKVKEVRDCKDMESEAPCTTFKYTMWFGDKYFEDPELEIVQ